MKKIVCVLLIMALFPTFSVNAAEENLNEYSIIYNIPAANSNFNLSDLELNSTSSQNQICIFGSNKVLINISNTQFNSSSTDNNYALFLDNTNNSLNITGLISHQTKYFFNNDNTTSATADNIDLSQQTNNKLSITVPYTQDGKTIISSNAGASRFNFIPLSNNYTCTAVENGVSIQLNVYFNINFNSNGGTMDDGYNQTETRFKVYSNFLLFASKI